MNILLQQHVIQRKEPLEYVFFFVIIQMISHFMHYFFVLKIKKGERETLTLKMLCSMRASRFLILAIYQ